MWGYYSHLDVVIIVPFINIIGLATIAAANLGCGDFFSEKICHKLVVSTSFWSFLLNVSSVLTSLKYTATLLWVVIALMICWQNMRVLSLGFLTFYFRNKSFFVFILDAIFCGTTFFIFQDNVRLVKKS